MNDVFDDRLRDLTVVHRSPITVGSLIFVAIAFALFVIVGAASVPAAGIAVVLIAVLWVTVAPIAAVAGAHIVLVAAVAPVFTAPLAIAAFVFFELACVILLAASAGKSVGQLVGLTGGVTAALAGVIWGTLMLTDSMLYTAAVLYVVFGTVAYGIHRYELVATDLVHT